MYGSFQATGSYNVNVSIGFVMTELEISRQQYHKMSAAAFSMSAQSNRNKLVLRLIVRKVKTLAKRGLRLQVFVYFCNILHKWWVRFHIIGMMMLNLNRF